MLCQAPRAASLFPTAELATPLNGQASVEKLVYAPLAFLSFKTETTTLAGILSSAVAFLEGYSADEIETDLQFVAKDDLSVVAHSQLKLVPYRSNTPPALKPVGEAFLPSKTVQDLSAPRFAKPIARVYHEVSISTVRNSNETADNQCGDTLSPREARAFEEYLNTFRTAPLFCDSATQSLLETTESPQLARAVFRCFTEAGLIAQPEVVLNMMQRLGTADEELLNAVIKHLETECDLGVLHVPTQVCRAPTPASSVSATVVQPVGRCQTPKLGRGKFDTVRARRQHT